MGDSQIKPPMLYIAQKSEPKLYLKAQTFYYDSTIDKLNNKNKEKTNIENEKTSIEKKKSSNSSFQNKTIDEKLEYLTKSSDFLPKMKCKIITDEKAYNCVINSFNDEEVNVKLLNTLNNHRIPKKNIQEILLIGF